MVESSLDAFLKAAEDNQPPPVQDQARARKPGDAAPRSQAVDKLDNAGLAMLLQNQNTFMEQIVVKLNGDPSSSRSKRSLEPGTSSRFEEPDMSLRSNWYIASLKIEDNLSTKLCMEPCLRLLPPSGDPKGWWCPDKFSSRFTTPVRGSSLNLEHILGSRNASHLTVRRMHDRTEFLKLQHLTPSNAHQSQESKPRLMVSDSGTSDAVGVSLDRNWKDTSSVHEMVEAVQNYAAISHALRPWSYEGLSFLRSLHAIRLDFVFFYAVY